MRRIDPVERVINLMTLLQQTPRPLTRHEIVEEMATGGTPYPTNGDAERQLFMADRRTITTDLGVQVRSKLRDGETEYWIDGDDAQIPRLDLDDDERVMLSLALAAVSRRVPYAGEAALKLGGTSIFESPIDVGVTLTDAAIDVINATTDHAVIELDHPDGLIELEPWSIQYDRGVWRVTGHDVGTDHRATVRLDQLTDRPRVVDRRHAGSPADQDAIEATVIGEASDDEPDIASVLVDETTAARAGLWPGVIEQSQVDLFGTVMFQVHVGDSRVFRDWLLELGERADVVDPPSLRGDMIRWLLGITEHEPSGVTIPPKPATAPGRRRGPEPAPARLHRLLSVVPWLCRHGSARIIDIAARVGASPDRVVRDLTLASMCGVPPYTPDALNDFRIDDDGTVHVISSTLRTDSVPLTARQAAAVSVALAALEALPGGDQTSVLALRNKLDAALGNRPVTVTVDAPPFLDDVRRAVNDQGRLRIEYVDLDDRITERDIDPLTLYVERGQPYVTAYDHLRDDVRNFRIDRVLSAMPTGEHFEPSPITPPADQTWRWMIPDREVIVRLPAHNTWVIDQYATAAHHLDDDGSLIVWLSVVSESWLANLLMRCGPGAEVLYPDDLTGLARQRAERILNRYDDGERPMASAGAS